MTDIGLSLIRRCKARDGDAFSLLFERYEGYLYRLCFKYLGNKEDALDLMQETYLKVFRNIESFDEKKDFLPWLRKITVNSCLNFLRIRQRINLSLDHSNDEGREFYENIPAAENVEEKVVALTVREGIRQGLECLSPDARMILTMHYLEGASYQEMSATLNQPLGTVKNSLFRARKHLKTILLKKGLLEV